MPDGTVCNPAFLPEVQEGTLLGRVYFGNGYTALSTANQFIYQPITKDFLQELFQKQNVTSVEAHIQLAFVAKYFSAEFSPYRVQYVSEVHNPNLPVIAVHAVVERSLTFGGGFPLSVISSSLEDFTFGTRLRLLERDYVHGSFSLFDAIGSDPRTLLPTKTQHGILMDPSIGWISPKMPWKLRASFSVNNVGSVWPADPLYPTLVDMSTGVGVEPPVGFGRWRIGLDLVNVIHGDDLMSRIRFGTSYKFGIAEVMGGFNTNSLTAGLQFGLNFITAGIVYEFVRNDFGGTAPENKLATELSIKL